MKCIECGSHKDGATFRGADNGQVVHAGECADNWEAAKVARHRAWRSTFVTAVDLLREAADALENNPHDKEPEEMHPQDAWCEASAALDVVAGLAVAVTNESRRCPGASPAK